MIENKNIKNNKMLKTTSQINLKRCNYVVTNNKYNINYRK